MKICLCTYVIRFKRQVSLKTNNMTSYMHADYAIRSIKCGWFLKVLSSNFKVPHWNLNKAIIVNSMLA